MQIRSKLFNRLFSHAVLTALLLISTVSVQADEGGMQVYIPGVYGSIHMAMVPDPGWYYLNVAIYGDIEADIVPSGGEVWVDLDVPLIANAFVPIVVTEQKIWGGNYFAAAGLPIVKYDVDATLLTNSTGIVGSYSSSGLSDLYAVPFGVTWRRPGLFFFLYEGINVPIGKYSLGNPKNIGLNHWAFDTNFALSWEVPESHWEINFNVGYMFNTNNKKTDYKSGSNVHLDYTFAYNVSKLFSLGFSGYYYKQITGDSGSGATLGSFKGEGYGIGPSISYMFNAGGKVPVSATFEWIHDLHTENRWKGDYLTLQLAIPLSKKAHF